MAPLIDVFNHLVLPPKLPGTQDEDIESSGDDILQRLVKAAKTLGDLASAPEKAALKSVRKVLRSYEYIHAQGRLERQTLTEELQNLEGGVPLIIHLVEQNAALMIRRETFNGADVVLFEAFETSLPSADVLASTTALTMDFPACAAQLPYSDFKERSFREALSEFLEMSSIEPLRQFQATRTKARTSVVESRDTASPALVTHLLIPLLESLGGPGLDNTPRLRKRVRDDATIHNAEYPWRRLPFWLVLRVCTQRQLELSLGHDAGRICYKFLISVLLAELLDDCPAQLSPDMTKILISKIGRRLAKLDHDRQGPISLVKELFAKVGMLFKKNISGVNETIEKAWERYKRETIRRIPLLPPRADESAQALSLLNSGAYVEDILRLPRTRNRAPFSLSLPKLSDGAIEQTGRFFNTYFDLAALEAKIVQNKFPNLASASTAESRCRRLAEAIFDVSERVGSSYDINPEQVSKHILGLFTLWVRLDKYAAQICPLILNYHPMFTPELLDTLHLPSAADMQRLQAIQVYLHDRCKNANPASVFSEPDKHAFAVAYVAQSRDMQRLLQNVQEDSTSAREEKESELEAWQQEYEAHSMGISGNTCVCKIERNGTRNVRGCKSCWHWRTRKRMEIFAHEDYLPSNAVKAAAIIFEVNPPHWFAAYRNATWHLIRLAYPKEPSAQQPKLLLKNDEALQEYSSNPAGGITLASGSKSFRGTHFKVSKRRMKATTKDVLYPHALNYRYFDLSSNVWVQDFGKPLTLQHLCGVHVPLALQQTVMPVQEHPPTVRHGSSSYDIVASETECPNSMSLHEFTAYQRLLSGQESMWLTILMELSASDVNLSTEASMHLISHLAVQAGPASQGTDFRRNVHKILTDDRFCTCLAEQIRLRLRSITSNWREIHCMEVLITLILRLYALGSSHIKEDAQTLLHEARQTTLGWIVRLRHDMRSATDSSTAETAAKYATWASLLCRRTFTTYTSQSLTPELLVVFVQASLALQENMIIDLLKLPPGLKSMLVRDAKMVYNLQATLLQAIEIYPESIGQAINESWSDSHGPADNTFGKWQAVPQTQDRWLATTMRNFKASTSVQVVHFNVIEGHLLVDGRPLGKLPHEIRESVDVKHLFGNQHLLTYPSSELGMSHTMATLIQGHKISFGLRGDQVVIRARTYNSFLEFIPQRIFEGHTTDLPLSLIDDCTHWLNLDTKEIEIRRNPVMWKTRKNDWIIDIERRQGRRGGTLLVDPQSVLFSQVARIFSHFEEPRKITVAQPPKGNMIVELRFLELSFYVKKGLLTCQELGEEIDPDQDIGTMYGLNSKIVLRDTMDINRRSMIVPLGAVSTERRGMHIAVTVASSPVYARFEVDNVLGRLTCAAEPGLLYAKAHFHALTSFVLPDRLTGRTGTEEALRILNAGSSQPWTPLGEKPIGILKAISDISPAREYYPRDKKTLQSVFWKSHLTMTIQSDELESAAQKILDTSKRELEFNSRPTGGSDSTQFVSSHLRQRGMLQRRLYERSSSTCDEGSAIDTKYNSRGEQYPSLQAATVYQIAKLYQSRPFAINPNRKLHKIMEGWSIIGGFLDKSGNVLASLSDLTEKSVSENFGSLVNACRASSLGEPHGQLFRLVLMTLSPVTDIDIVKILTAFARVPELKLLQPPACAAFNQFKHHDVPDAKNIFKFIAVDLPQQTPRMNTAQRHHCKMHEAEGKRLARHLQDQWPCKDLSVDEFDAELIDENLAMNRVLPEWQRLHANAELSQYIDQVQEILDRYSSPIDKVTPNCWDWPYEPGAESRISIDSSTILKQAMAKPLAAAVPEPKYDTIVRDGIDRHDGQTRPEPAAVGQTNEAMEMRAILGSFVSSSDPLRQQYGCDLEASLDALERSDSSNKTTFPAPNLVVVNRKIYALRTLIAGHFKKMCDALSAQDSRFQWLDLAGLWPCNELQTILEQLRSASENKFGAGVKEMIVSHGIMITMLQRLVRIRYALDHGKITGLQEELGNLGHENWNPEDYPDWLLLEIDSNILIRPEQADVARAIIAPSSGQNTVLQLNMGKGKTSCIVPMAIAVLGNGLQLPRLIVPEPLLLPTAQMIQARLGGLVGRELCHIPFSRKTKPTTEILTLYKDIHEGMLRRRGVMLNAPKHVLSYKLSGLQQLAVSDMETAQAMIQFQSWLESNCRDVMDETDVSLAVKTQLIYPSGELNTVDGHPQRWEVAQALLAMVKDYLPELRRAFPQSIEVVDRNGGFPMIHLLRPDVEEDIHQRIISLICTGKSSFLRFAHSTSGNYEADIREVLLEPNLDTRLLDKVAALFINKDISEKILLLVRGILRNGILLLCLKKRWNVQYGLHPGRDPIAVPFDAKSTPSEQSEYGHPDSAIIFTCLSFYYTGVTQAQFRMSLRQVLASQDPSSEYDRWTSSCETLTETFHHWNAVNIDDQAQIEELWKHLRHSRSVLDHFMNHFVFPAHAKQFSVKLQASGWDLPLIHNQDSGKEISAAARTTGFSGTNDNKTMLPLTIRQHDLPSLQQTNAEVLTYLLQYRNRKYHRAAKNDKRMSEVQFLQELTRLGIRVLIDAGAFILEMKNEDLVAAWMEIDHDAKAAIFFGSDNRAWVRFRKTKNSIPLLATPFADNMDGCLVYFDEAHTRGVDLKLPPIVRGALTLSLGQTKDHTVQAAMRLRQLATTQSVSFFAFPETHQSIIDTCKLDENAKIDSSHVISWSLEQTCRANEQLRGLYIAQGTDFCDQTAAKWDNTAFLSNQKQRAAYVSVLQHPEEQTLQDLYGRSSGDAARHYTSKKAFPQIDAFKDQISKLKDIQTHGSNTIVSSALEEVEQEREVEFQVEEVREAQRPVRHQAHSYPGLHDAILEFCRTGILSGGEGYKNFSAVMAQTSVGQKFSISEVPSALFVSAEFMKTIRTTDNRTNDNFMRPVEWILYSPVTSTALIIIAEEAEELIPVLFKSHRVTKAHLLAYSTPVTKKMLPIGSLKYFALPSLSPGHQISQKLALEIGIFAGRLYMEFDECSAMMKYISSVKLHNGQASATKTANFLFEWTSRRRKDQDIKHTPMGYICSGRTLDSSHAFFTKSGDESKAVASLQCSTKATRCAVDGADEEDDEYDDDDE